LEKSDEMLVNEIKEGQMESYDELMQRHQKNVYRIAHSFAKNEQGAMDITQNIFLKAYENIDRFREESQFKTWLTRISYNEGQNWIRKNKKHFTHEDLNNHLSEASSSVTQEDDFLAIENKTILLRSLYDLNTKYRLAIVLRYFENYPIRDIADTLNCSEGVVKNMLHRSLLKLRKSLTMIDIGENHEK
jgi:RNA polymerase sigma-70 factor (ECF subfamily)